MNPDDMKLESVSKQFEFEKISRELDTCTNIEMMRNLCKCYVKLYMRQQETLIFMEQSFGSK
jgi:hypothetical protein